MPTVIIANARDIVEHCGVARLLFTDFPLGSPCGEPFNADMQSAIVGQAFDLLETATATRTTVTAPFAWSEGEDWKGKIFTPEQPFLEGDDHDAWIRRKDLYKKLKDEGKA